MGGGVDAETQSAQMIMQGAQVLMQAAQLNPALVPIVQRAVEALRVGVQGMASGAGAGPPAPPTGGAPTRRRRSRREETPPEGAAGEMM